MTVGPPGGHVRVEDVDGDLVLFDTERSQMYELNPTAGDVWRLCTGEYSEEEIVRLLASAYGVDPAAIATDVAGVVAEFRSKGLLAPDPES